MKFRKKGQTQNRPVRPLCLSSIHQYERRQMMMMMMILQDSSWYFYEYSTVVPVG